MKVLEIAEDILDKMPMCSFDCLYRGDAVIKNRRTSKILRKNGEPKNLMMSL